MKGSTLLMILILFLLCWNLYFSYMNYHQVQAVRQENTNLWMKIDSLQHVSGNKASGQKGAPSSASPSTGSPLLDFIVGIVEEGEKEAAEERARETIEVTSRYRLENRYVLYKVHEPEYKGAQAGEVVLDILVNHSGDVKSARLRNVTGITDEEVVEACKKAALRSDFNFDSDAGERQSGTITYIFSAK